LSAFRILQRLVTSYLGMDALDRVSAFHYGYAPLDESVQELWPNEPHQIQLYAEVAKGIRAVGGAIAPSRLLEVCCGRGGGLAHLHATLSLRRQWDGSIAAGNPAWPER
jgi:hypothetical protein